MRPTTLEEAVKVEWVGDWEASYHKEEPMERRYSVRTHEQAKQEESRKTRDWDIPSKSSSRRNTQRTFQHDRGCSKCKGPDIVGIVPSGKGVCKQSSM